MPLNLMRIKGKLLHRQENYHERHTLCLTHFRIIIHNLMYTKTKKLVETTHTIIYSNTKHKNSKYANNVCDHTSLYLQCRS